MYYLCIANDGYAEIVTSKKRPTNYRRVFGPFRTHLNLSTCISITGAQLRSAKVEAESVATPDSETVDTWEQRVPVSA
jgi:hypothetical protein